MKSDFNLNKIICNLIGATEILEIAYLNGDMKSTMQAIKKIEEYRNILKQHEKFDKEKGT